MLPLKSFNTSKRMKKIVPLLLILCELFWWELLSSDKIIRKRAIERMDIYNYMGGVFSFTPLSGVDWMLIAPAALCCDAMAAFLCVILNIGVESVRLPKPTLGSWQQLSCRGTWYQSRLFSAWFALLLPGCPVGFPSRRQLSKWVLITVMQLCGCLRVEWALRRSAVALEVWSVYILTWPPVHSFRRSIFWAFNPTDPRCQHACTHLSHASFNVIKACSAVIHSD